MNGHYENRLQNTKENLTVFVNLRDKIKQSNDNKLAVKFSLFTEM